MGVYSSGDRGKLVVKPGGDRNESEDALASALTPLAHGSSQICCGDAYGSLSVSQGSWSDVVSTNYCHACMFLDCCPGNSDGTAFSFLAT